MQKSDTIATNYPVKGSAPAACKQRGGEREN